jgi:hypothetical protein
MKSWEKRRWKVGDNGDGELETTKMETTEIENGDGELETTEVETSEIESWRQRKWRVGNGELETTELETTQMES